MADKKNDANRFFQDIRERNFDRLLDKFHVINSGHYIAAIPSDTPNELIKGMFGAMTAYSMNYKSIDYVLKQYGEVWDEKIGVENQEGKLFDEISDLISTEIRSVVHWVNEIDQKPDIFGLFLANASLARLQSSFRTAQLLIRLGYVFEASALCRLILEQIAWAFAIHEIKDESALKVSPSRSITQLKTMFSNVGNTYGFLNKFTHIDPSLVSQYLDYGEDDKFSIVLYSADQKLSWGVFLLDMADLYTVVYEYIFRNVASKFHRIEFKKGKYLPLASRKMRDEVKKYFEIASEYEKK